MRHRHTLRPPRRPRRINHIRQTDPAPHPHHRRRHRQPPPDATPPNRSIHRHRRTQPTGNSIQHLPDTHQHHTAPAIRQHERNRSTGYSGSTGRYAATRLPHRQHRHHHVHPTRQHKPTTDSAPTPRPTSNTAPTDSPAHPTPHTTPHPTATTATASGDRATRSSNNSGTVATRHPTAVSFHSTNTRRRPASSSTPTALNGTSTPPSNDRLQHTRPALHSGTISPATTPGSIGATPSTVRPHPAPLSSTATVSG